MWRTRSRDEWSWDQAYVSPRGGGVGSGFGEGRWEESWRRWWKGTMGKSMTPYRSGLPRRMFLVLLLVITVWMYKVELGAIFSPSKSSAARVGEMGLYSALEASTETADAMARQTNGTSLMRLGTEVDFVEAGVVEGGNRTLRLEPVEWKRDGTRFLLYFPLYGQLNNQLNSLINALVLAKMLGSVLVVPRVEAGFDSRFGQSTDSRAGLKIIGDYFDWDRIARVQGVIHIDEFLASPVAAGAVKRGRLVVTPTFNTRTLAKEKSFYPYEFFLRPEERSKDATEELKKSIQTALGLDSKVGKCESWFDTIEEAAKQDTAVNGRLNIMSCMYQTITEDWGCQQDVPYWYEVRRHLVPREELDRTVRGWYASFESPVLAVHLRLLFKEETIEREAIYDHVRDVLAREGSVGLDAVRTIYLAFGNREHDLIKQNGAIEYLQQKLAHVAVRTCADMDNCAPLGDNAMEIPKLSPWASDLRVRDPNLFDKIFRSPYSSAILDMWACVNSDIFVGRSGSTLSRNVGYWRVVFNTTKVPLPSHYYKGLDVPSPAST